MLREFQKEYVNIGRWYGPYENRRVIEIKSKEPQRLDSLYLALDVGSYSLRAGLFDCRGKMLGTTDREISVLNPGGDCHEQSSSEIWDRAVDALNEVLEKGDRRKVMGISFDATCSLVLFAKDGKPLCISTSGDPERNTAPPGKPNL
jgi:ribulose kinase